MPRSVMVIAALVICLTLLTSCNFFDQTGKLTSISVTPASPFVATSAGTQQFTATGVNDDGSTSSVTGVTWTASSPTNLCSGCTATISINSTGLATVSGTGSGILGTSTITATSGSVTGSTTMTITSTPLTAIVVSPPTATVNVSGAPNPKTQQFHALFNTGSGADITNSVTWSSSNTTVASIDNTTTKGLATAGTTSTTQAVTITATAGTISGTATLTVSP